MVPASAAGIRAISARRTSAEAAGSWRGIEQVPAVQRAFQTSPMAAAALGLGERSSETLRSSRNSVFNQPAPQPRVEFAVLHMQNCCGAWCVVRGVNVAHGRPEIACRITT